jgi:hypothetical protein
MGVDRRSHGKAMVLDMFPQDQAFAAGTSRIARAEEATENLLNDAGSRLSVPD